MSPDERDDYERYYFWLNEVSARFDLTRPPINLARHYTVVGFDPSHLSPEQIEEEIKLTQAAIYQHYWYGLGLWSATLNFPGVPGPSLQELEAIVHESDADGTGFDPAALDEVKKFSQSGNNVEAPEGTRQSAPPPH